MPWYNTAKSIPYQCAFEGKTTEENVSGNYITLVVSSPGLDFHNYSGANIGIHGKYDHVDIVENALYIPVKLVQVTTDDFGVTGHFVGINNHNSLTKIDRLELFNKWDKVRSEGKLTVSNMNIGKEALLEVRFVLKTEEELTTEDDDQTVFEETKPIERELKHPIRNFFIYILRPFGFFKDIKYS